MLASLRQAEWPATQHRASQAAPLLDPNGARIILGGSASQNIPVSITPTAATLFAPRGAWLVRATGPLFVCDTGHHRLLAWHEAPEADDTPADLVIGQPDFSNEGPNANGEVGAATLYAPTGVASDGEILAVADAWNHRVLLWHGLPRSSNQLPDVVLGQPDFRSGTPNRGLRDATPQSLNWCFGVAISDRRLYVADTGNRRVLIWEGIPQSNGAPADLVLGQQDLARRDLGAGVAAGAAGMRWPHAVTAAAGMLIVADAGTSRLMIWQGKPDRDGAPCDIVLGQESLMGSDHNGGLVLPTAATLDMAYGVAAMSGVLVAADTANSRLLGFDLMGVSTGAAACRLTGQPNFTEKGENRWAPAARDSLCWPYGVGCCDRTAVIADSGNNRVLLWDLA